MIIIAVALLAAAGAAAVTVATENTGFALTAFALGVVEGAAVVGLYRMVASDATAGEVIAALAVTRMLGTLYELEFLHDRLRRGLDDLDRLHVATVPGSNNGSGVTADGDGGPVIHLTTDPVPGQAVLLASLGAVVAMLWLALGRFLGGGPTVGRFGLALTVGLLIEVANRAAGGPADVVRRAGRVSHGGPPVAVGAALRFSTPSQPADLDRRSRLAAAGHRLAGGRVRIPDRP